MTKDLRSGLEVLALLNKRAISPILRYEILENLEKLIPCCSLSKSIVMQLNLPCTLLVILIRLTLCEVSGH